MIREREDEDWEERGEQKNKREKKRRRKESWSPAVFASLCNPDDLNSQPQARKT